MTKKNRPKSASTTTAASKFSDDLIPDSVKGARKWVILAMIFPFLSPLVVIGYLTIVLRRSYCLKDGTPPFLDSLAFTLGGITFTWVAYVLATLVFLLSVVLWLELRRRKFRRLEWAFVFCSSTLIFSFLSVAFLRVYALVYCPPKARQALFTAIELAPDYSVAALQHWVFYSRSASEYSASSSLIVRDRKNANNPTLNLFFKNYDEAVSAIDSLVHLGFVEKKELPIDVLEDNDKITVNRQVFYYRVAPKGLNFYRSFLWSRNLGAPEWLIEPIRWHYPRKELEDVAVPLPEYYPLPRS